MFNNKADLFGFSHFKSNKFNDVSGHRASRPEGEYLIKGKGLHAALSILTRE